MNYINYKTNMINAPATLLNGNGRLFLNLFTEDTYRVFVEEQKSAESGFPASRKGWAKKLRVGDYLACYATGEAKKFFGLLKVESEAFEKHDSIWEGRFPIRVKVKTVMVVEPNEGAPIEEILPNLSGYQALPSKNRWSILVRGSLREFKGRDAEIITNAIEMAKNKPVKPLSKDKGIELSELHLSAKTTMTNVNEVSSQSLLSVETHKEVIKRQIRNLDELKDLIPHVEFKTRLRKLIDSYQFLT